MIQVLIQQYKLNYFNLKNKPMKAKLKVGDLVNHKVEMFESFLHHKATITKVFKNGKVKLEFRTWTGIVNVCNVNASELLTIK